MKKKDRRKLKFVAYHMAANHSEMTIGMAKALVNAEERNKDKDIVRKTFDEAIRYAGGIK